MHQRTTLYLLTCHFTKSVLGQWFLICTSSPSIAYCSHHFQAISLYCIGRKLLARCIHVPSLKDIVVVPQSGGRDLCRIGIVWLHLIQCQKVGVHQVWLIHPSCLLVYCQAFFQCSRSLIILTCQERSNQWSSRGIYLLFPA